MDDLLRLILLKDPNTRVVLLGASLLGLASGVLGTFAVLRRRALLGDALAHAALPGICVAYFIVGDKSLPAFLLGALVFGILGVLVVTFVRKHSRIKEDAAIGIVLSTFFGLGIVLSRIIQNQPSGNRAGLDTYIFGKAAAMVRADVYSIALLAGLVLLIVVLFFKEFRLLCFDRDFAATQGWPVTFLDVLLMGLIAVIIVIGLPAVGVVLMAALLIVPAAAARFWTNRLEMMVLASAAIGLVSGLTGTAFSALAPKFSAGPLIVLSATFCFLVSLLFAPRRGVLADIRRRMSLKRKIELENVLRALYEVQEREVSFEQGVTFPELLQMRAWPRTELRQALARVCREKLVVERNGRYLLTLPGEEKARRVVRTHRLWEAFLIEHADIAADHVDRDADEIEHVLAPDIVRELENRLRESGRLPEKLPVSPHPIRGV